MVLIYHHACIIKVAQMYVFMYVCMYACMSSLNTAYFSYHHNHIDFSVTCAFGKHEFASHQNSQTDLITSSVATM